MDRSEKLDLQHQVAADRPWLWIVHFGPIHYSARIRDLLNAPTTDALCGGGQMGDVAPRIEKPSWRLTLGGPLDLDPST